MYTWVIHFPDLHNFITYKKKNVSFIWENAKKRKKHTKSSSCFLRFLEVPLQFLA